MHGANKQQRLKKWKTDDPVNLVLEGYIPKGVFELMPQPLCHYHSGTALCCVCVFGYECDNAGKASSCVFELVLTELS